MDPGAARHVVNPQRANGDFGPLEPANKIMLRGISGPPVYTNGTRAWRVHTQDENGNAIAVPLGAAQCTEAASRNCISLPLELQRGSTFTLTGVTPDKLIMRTPDGKVIRLRITDGILTMPPPTNRNYYAARRPTRPIHRP